MKQYTDSLFTTQAERDDARLERVMNLSLSEVSAFPNHPFKVRMDAEMREMSESVKQYGVLVAVSESKTVAAPSSSIVA